MLEPEAFEWVLGRGDTLEISWAVSPADAPCVRWYGNDCVTVFPPGDSDGLLNGSDAFKQLQHDAPNPTI